MVQDKIDFVITWLDDSDLIWRNERNELFPDKKFDDSRYRDWGLLKYWFRGVEQFAPWVNNIYFITYGHLPEFLDINNPKLKIVNHKDYMKDEYLPTYCSNAIELSMHKIKGLEEKFVYFNDDTFIIKETNVEDFFEKGLPKDVAILNPIVPKYYGSISNVMANNMSIINTHFRFRESFSRNKTKWINKKYGKLVLMNILFQPWSSAVGIYQQHLPSSFLKSSFEKIWESEYEVLNETSIRKFRDNFRDVNQWLVKKWQVMEGNFSPRRTDTGKYIMMKTKDNIKEVQKSINDKRTKLLCINDHLENEDVDNVIQEMESLLDNLLPNKSSFEV